MGSMSFCRSSRAVRIALGLGASVTGVSPALAAAAQCNAPNIQTMVPADTRIVSAVPTAAPVPHCRVDGYVTTQNPGPNRVNFRLQLPDKDWNGRYFFIGLGATAGFVPTDAQIPAGNPIIQGFAVAGTDTGHQNLADWSFIGRNPAQAEDYRHRGGHVSTVAAQQITKKYYGVDKMWRYHAGCSGGGRMGMEAITGHPGDYDGVLLGAPGLGPTFGAETMLDFIYVGQQMIREPGAWLSPAKLQMMDRKVTAHCDPLDGATDGIVWDRKACTFDFKALQCTGADGPECLTGPELRSVEALLRGPRSPSGPIKHGWPITNMSVWSGFIGAPPPWPSPMRLDKLTPDGMRTVPVGYFMGNSLARAYFGDDFNALTDFDFNDQKRIDAWWAAASAKGFGAPYSADINPYRKLGGKVIFWNGVSDPCCLDEDLVGYYKAVGEKVGSPMSLQSFARMYKVPGMAHCGGGTGPQDAPDKLLQALIEWVEKGKAPAAVVTHRGDRAQPSFADPKTGTVSGVVVPPSTGTPRDFLLCPYPQVAKFNGKAGGEADAVNWSCKMS
jgi:feruloyl esterase